MSDCSFARPARSGPILVNRQASYDSSANLVCVRSLDEGYQIHTRFAD